jgi:peptidoglycan/xylan/chitin deacetylase (PgdA/CDA1 family)
MTMMFRRGAGPYILMYHSIAEPSEDPYTVPAKRFQDQLSWLLGHDFQPVALADIVNLLKIGDYQRLARKVAFTFDDGSRDFLTDALPILLRHKATATVFIVTGMLGHKAAWRRDRKQVQLMTEDEVRHIRAQGMALGSHTVTHANLRAVNREELYAQITESRATLKDLGESFYSFSYPWGQCTSQVAGAVRDSGYECAVTVGGEMHPRATDIYCLPRITMSADMDLCSFQELFDRPAVKRIRQVRRVLKRYLP